MLDLERCDDYSIKALGAWSTVYRYFQNVLLSAIHSTQTATAENAAMALIHWQLGFECHSLFMVYTTRKMEEEGGAATAAAAAAFVRPLTSHRLGERA